MKRQYLPYYISRGMLSILFAILVFGLSWKAMIFTILFISLFLLYFHGGWFQVDMTNPLFPLHRDNRGIDIQRKALITSIMVGIGLYILSSTIPLLSPIGSIILIISIVVYFGTQFCLFILA
jgi:hypothetical protein